MAGLQSGDANVVKEPVIRVDLGGFLHVDGIKVCRVDRAQGVVEFVDKDRRRSAARGGRVVRVSVTQLQAALTGPKASQP